MARRLLGAGWRGGYGGGINNSRRSNKSVITHAKAEALLETENNTKNKHTKIIIHKIIPVEDPQTALYNSEV